jgi:hypothetical protein
MTEPDTGLVLHDGQQLPTTRNLRSVLREGLDAVQAEEYEKRGGAEVAKPEDAYALLRRYGAMAETATDYSRAFADFAKDVRGRAGDELSTMYGEQDGVPNDDATVPDTDGTTLKIKRDHANSYSFDLDLIISGTVVGMLADPEVNKALGEMFQAEFRGEADATVQHLSWVLAEAVRRVLATGKFDPQVTKVRALAKAAAAAGDDQLSSTVTGAIKKTTVLKGFKIEREQPKEK